MSNYLELDRPMEVRTGDYRRKWMEAQVISVCIDDVGEDEDGNVIKGLSFSVKFIEDGCTQRLSDAFGWNRENWRYKDEGKCCDECVHLESDGGDAVPYGSTTANLPECKYCVCPDVSEDDIDAYCEATDFGKKCHHFKQRS